MTLDVDIRAERQGFSLDVTFSVPAGITYLLGPSGAGKSTTLACIAGLLRPSEGKIKLGETVWFDSARGIEVDVAERKLGYVFQSLALFPHMTALDNVAYGLPGELATGEREKVARGALGAMQAAHLADRKPGTYSGGEAQRVAIARALARAPRLLLLDEPFSALDRALRKQLAEEVRERIGELGIPAIFVTHQDDEARGSGAPILRLEKGRLAVLSG